ncbi:cobalamin B12-binding domain-containing protein [Aureimonas leprariae]|nr:cobalamin B12-binding domain-containing protein [Aureimonas leprariae]
MGEARLASSVPSGSPPDFPLGLDDVLPGLRASETPDADGPAACGSLIARAISEVAARRRTVRMPAERGSSEAAEAPSPHPRVLDFVEALFDDSPRRCRAIAEDAFSETPDPQSLAASLFAPAAGFIGERWIADENDFLQVTVALARIQQIFSRLAADSPAAVRPDAARRLLLAPAPGEQHGFGLVVVEDAFARAGWTVDRCGGGDAERLIRKAAAGDYLAVGVSIGSERWLPALRSVAERLRAGSRRGSVVLMAGGSAAVRHPQEVLDLGFDFVATDASSGVRLAEAFLAKRAKVQPRTVLAH